MNLTVPVTVRLAERKMEIESILKIRVGTIIEFNKSVDADLILEVADRPIGCGQAVKVGENFGLRISKIESIEERIGSLGPGRS